MTEGFNLKFFNAAMKAIKPGTSSTEFATNYANACNAEKGSSLWQKAYEEGLKQFSTMDMHKGSEGKIDEEELKIIGLYVERMNGKSQKLPQTVEEFSGNKTLDSLWHKESRPQKPSNPNIPERHHLKPIDTMTKEEIQAEISKYTEMGLIKESCEEDKDEIKNTKSDISDKKTMLPENELKLLKAQLSSIRAELNETDKNSDIIDMHIGTFNQGGLGDCTMLSQLNGLTDEQLAKIIQRKTDENGKIFYEVTFPIDFNNGTSVKITEEELKSRELSITNGDTTYTETKFSIGDADVTLMEMAYIRRFGIDPAVLGADMKFVNDIFSFPGEKTHVGTTYNLTEEKLISAMKDNEHATLSLTHASRLKEDFSYEETFQSSSGITAEMGLYKLDKKKIVIERLKAMYEKLGNENPDLSEYEKMSEAELMNAVNRFVSEDFWFTGELRLSNGVSIIEDHAFSLKNYNPQTKELTIANPHKNNEDIIIPLDIAEKYFEISL